MFMFKRKTVSEGTKLIVEYIKLYERRIEVLKDLLQTCKAIAVEADKILQSFYCIPYMKISEGFSELQIELLHRNRHLFTNHGTWFISCSKHHIADIFIKSTNNTTLCASIKCPFECKPKISSLQSIELLRIQKVGQDVKRNIISSFISSYEPLLEYYLIFLVMEVEYIEKLYTYIVQQQLVHRIFFFLKHLRSLDESFKHKLANVISLSSKTTITGLMSLENKLDVISAILDNPTLFPSFKNKLYDLEGTILVKGRIEEMLILKKDENSLSKFLFMRTSLGRYIFVERNALVYSCISNCINTLFRLMELPYEYPPFIIFTVTHGEYILDTHDTLKSPVDIWKHYSSITALSLYTVISYIFGTEDDTIIWRTNSFFPLLYDINVSNKEETTSLKVAEIIYSLGGRNSGLYTQYISKTIELFLLFRKRFLIILQLLEPIKTSRIALEARLYPRKTDAQAIRIFTNTISKNASNSLGIWKYIGY